MAKSYTWNEIQKFLEDKLKTTKHILTYGTIGSCNIEHDIDTIITKKPDSKSSDFYKEIHNLFEAVNSYLKKKYNCKLIRTSRFDHEDEVQFIAKKNENDLVFQVMTYISFSQIKKHWIPNMIVGEDVKEILENSYNCILGNTQDLFKINFLKELKYEGMFLYLNDLDRINSSYNEDFLVFLMNKLFDYIFRKRLNEKVLQGSTSMEIKEIFYKLCDKLDELENKRTNLK